VRPQHSWQEAVVRHLSSKTHLRSFADTRRDLPSPGSLPGGS
jgi:hypothetical protein